ncbi:MAG: NADP-dependent phosphogluconate dehydrogenase [Patescibacteria group bacterium]
MPRQIGIVGLGVMGRNLALNMARHGIGVAGLDLDAKKGEQLLAQAKGLPVEVCGGWERLLDALETPRRVLVMVPAGAAVDAVLAELRPRLRPGDLVIDGGNSHFAETARREEELRAAGVLYLGAGISGGEEGALRGPCIMPGGRAEAYSLAAPILTRIAAEAGGEACCAYMGTGGAGHFVKMVHNGIEYGIMQLICETFDFLRRGLGMTTQEIRGLLAGWQEAELSSFLLEITVLVLGRMDPETGLPLVDLILDHAEQKGTGKWTAQSALDLGVAVPTLAAAVEARILSGLKEERVQASGRLPGPRGAGGAGRREMAAVARRALGLGMLACYAQGMALLAEASRAYGYGLPLAEIARIWRGGCIIRARMLEEIRQALREEPGIPNLLLAPVFAGVVEGGQAALRVMVAEAARLGVPLACGAATLAYYDGYRSERLPANLLQAQRDHFGAHTYRRIDRKGVFHTDWTESREKSGGTG